MLIKYRRSEERLSIRRTKLQIPGWAGKPEPRVNGSHEYAWHCIPFSEAAQYGVELFYPYDNELHISTIDGDLVFESDWGPGPTDGKSWPPFRSFGKEYYTYQLLLDFKVEDGFSIKFDTHPSFYTDKTGTVPIAVPALIRNWWPIISFMVFKSPEEGKTHIFRKNAPFVQIVFVPADSDFQLVEMTKEESAERELQSRRIHASRDTLTKDSTWTSDTNTVFDATYRRISTAVKKLARKNGA